MRDAVPLILRRATEAHGAHAEAGWTARGTEEQYRPLCGLIFSLNCRNARFLVREGGELITLARESA